MTVHSLRKTSSQEARGGWVEQVDEHMPTSGQGMSKNARAPITQVR